MKNLLVEFNDLANDSKALTKLTKPFGRAGANVIEANADSAPKRTSGVTYREVLLTFADGQTVTLQIKQSGDIYAVKLNGKPYPIKNQDDHLKAVKELADAMDAGRAKFQKDQIAKAGKEANKVPGVKSVAPKIRDTLTEQVTVIETQIAEKTAKRDELKTKLGATLDSVEDASEDPDQDGDAEGDNDDDGDGEFQESEGQESLELDSAGIISIRGVLLSHGVLASGAKGTYADWREALEKSPARDRVIAVLKRCKNDLSDKDKLDDFLEDAAVLDTAVLDAARKMNQKDYAFYVVANSKIESGWEYRDDAKEHKAENMPEKLRKGAVIVSKSGLKSLKIDPDDNASWLTTADMDSTQEQALDDAGVQLIEGVPVKKKSPEQIAKEAREKAFGDLNDGERRILKYCSKLNGKCPRQGLIDAIFGCNQSGFTRGMDAVCSLIRKRLIKVTGDTIPAKAVVELTGDAMQMAKENAFILDAVGDYVIYHDSFSSACSQAIALAKKQGYEVDEDSWFASVSNGPRKPDEGKTNRYSIVLTKGGKEQKKLLHFQVYGRDNGYELNAYIS